VLNPVIARTEVRISGRPKSDFVTSVQVLIHHVSLLDNRATLMEGTEMLTVGSSAGRVRGSEMASLPFAVAFRRYQTILVGAQ
jgi:hypothetical protein